MQLVYDNLIIILNSDYTRSEIERRCEGTTIKENTTLLGQLNEGESLFI
jgi:hypothetical protein